MHFVEIFVLHATYKRCLAAVPSLQPFRGLTLVFPLSFTFFPALSAVVAAVVADRNERVSADRKVRKVVPSLNM